MADNQQQGTALLSQIPFGAIIGSPLKAAVDAQGAAALACYDFVQKVGFDTVTTQTPGEPAVTTTKVREITFVFERQIRRPALPPPGDSTSPSGPTGDATEKLSITVPLLTIMPLPFVRIESMNINFKASISAVDTSSQTQNQSTDAQARLEGSVGFALWKLNVGGSVSSKKDSTATNTSKYSVEHTMDISVHAVQDDMPAGLAKLLSLMTESIVVARG
jgi:hypothetical protein